MRCRLHVNFEGQRGEPISGLQSAECDTTFESCSAWRGQSDRQSDTKKKSVPQNEIDVQAPGSFASVRLLIRKSHGFLRTNRCQACSHSKGEWVHLRAGLWPVLHSTDSQGNRGRVRANGSIIASLASFYYSEFLVFLLGGRTVSKATFACLLAVAEDASTICCRCTDKEEFLVLVGQRVDARPIDT